MYGSSFQLEQSMNTSRQMNASATSNEKTWVALVLALIILAVSTSSFAGSKQPKLAGGNGNAQGR